MAPKDCSTPVESTDSPEELGPLSPDNQSVSSDDSASTMENILNDVDFNLKVIDDEYVCTVDVTGLGIANTDIMLDLPEDWLYMDMDTETLLGAFLEWEIPIILAALQDQN